MVSSQQLLDLIAIALKVDKAKVTEDLAIGDIPEWDSMGHLSIIASVEKEFEITLDVEQVIEIEDFDDLLEAINSSIS